MQKKLMVSLAAFLMVMFMIGTAPVGATTVNFSGAPYGDLNGVSIGGFTFQGNWKQWSNDSIQVPYMESYDTDHSIIFNAGSFTFNAASLNGWPWDNYGSSGGTLTAQFKDLGGSVIATRNIYLPGNNVFLTLSDNISGVHEIYFPATNGFWPRLESITYNAVPIPAAAWLLGSGLLGLLGLRRKFSK